eukprot:TRINITY_DN10908_c0_g2_i1.p2 TRINITY_DN10908_c0_g2~~TRINITY_DN10908_c0_g2_i1.p2  ORF type:complete len:182 (-),score=35.55 TRINITY_DN10908_c0_g2_i1:722-1267(-)
MQRGLVGSEMCIRDSKTPKPQKKYFIEKMINLEEERPCPFDKYDKMIFPSAEFSWEESKMYPGLCCGKIIWEGCLQEMDSDSIRLHSSRYYAATPHALLRFVDKDKKNLLAVLRLPWPRLEFFKDQVLWKYGFSLTAHEVTRKFTAPSQDEAKKWYSRLRQDAEVALIHFSRDYDVGKLIK